MGWELGKTKQNTGIVKITCEHLVTELKFGVEISFVALHKEEHGGFG